jgi:2-phospho-L-lactate guanylyltransferase
VIRPDAPPAGWCLVVPVKPLDRAKSRLAAPDIDPVLRARLALAFAADMVEAALSAKHVVGIVAVTDDGLAAEVLGRIGAAPVPDLPDAGLNPAFAHGARIAREMHGDVGVAAVAADLPALRAEELDAVLEAVSEPRLSRPPRWFVPDAHDIGTTMLFAPSGIELDPRFGGPSRRAHLDSGAELVGLPDIASLRRDVDTPEDLAAAVRLGVGPRTAALLGGGSGTVGA